MRPGCRQAPRALRDASARFGWLGEPEGASGFFDIESKHTFLDGRTIVDAGDVDVSLDEAVTRERVTAHARRIVETGAVRAAIGGDHSVTFPLISAFESQGPLTVILFDAHREADGVTFRQAKRLLRSLGTRGRLVGVDLVEVNPYLDQAELTQHIAVQLLIEALAGGDARRR